MAWDVSNADDRSDTNPRERLDGEQIIWRGSMEHMYTVCRLSSVVMEENYTITKSMAMHQENQKRYNDILENCQYASVDRY